MTESDKPTIMIADADPNVRSLVARFISDAGYNVSLVSDGYEALDSARKEPPLAILADIMLPKLDGLALCRLIKSDPDTAHIITVIVFSVFSAEERSKKAGADAFLQKPLEKNRLLKTLEEARKLRSNSA